MIPMNPDVKKMTPTATPTTLPPEPILGSIEFFSLDLKILKCVNLEILKNLSLRSKHFVKFGENRKK